MNIPDVEARAGVDGSPQERQATPQVGDASARDSKAARGASVDRAARTWTSWEGLGPSAGELDERWLVGGFAVGGRRMRPVQGSVRQVGNAAPITP